AGRYAVARNAASAMLRLYGTAAEVSSDVSGVVNALTSFCGRATLNASRRSDPDALRGTFGINPVLTNGRPSRSRWPPSAIVRAHTPMILFGFAGIEGMCADGNSIVIASALPFGP